MVYLIHPMCVPVIMHELYSLRGEIIDQFTYSDFSHLIVRGLKLCLCSLYSDSMSVLTSRFKALNLNMNPVLSIYYCVCMFDEDWMKAFEGSMGTHDHGSRAQGGSNY